jgi:hypothetical protein
MVLEETIDVSQHVGPTTLILMDDSASGAYSWSHEPAAVRIGLGLGPPLESTHRWTGQLGLRYLTAPNGAEGLCGPEPGWNRLQAETATSRAVTDRDQDVEL